MAAHKQILAFCVMALALGLALWSSRPGRTFVPSIRLPQGVSLAEVLRAGKTEPPKGWHTNIYCHRHLVPLRMRLDPAVLREEIRYRVHEVFGPTLCRAPNTPTCDFVTPRLGECFQVSGERYLLAKEFIWEVGFPTGQDSRFTFLWFVWGGTNQPRHARDRVALTEEGILKSGIFGMRMKWSRPQQQGVMTREYFPTNQCAIIRDAPGLVKIVPLEYLQAYVDAGLVRLPNSK
jgi:hypothetical protein